MFVSWASEQQEKPFNDREWSRALSEESKSSYAARAPNMSIFTQLHLYTYSDQARQGDFPQHIIRAIGLAEVNQPFCLSLKEQLLHLLDRSRQQDRIKSTHFFSTVPAISAHESLCQREGWIYLDPSIAGDCQHGSLRKQKDGMFLQSAALMISHAERHIIYFIHPRSKTTRGLHINQLATQHIQMRTHPWLKDMRGKCDSQEILIGCQQPDVCLRPISLSAYSPHLTAG